MFDESEIQRKQDERDNLTARLRKLELNVEQVPFQCRRAPSIADCGGNISAIKINCIWR